jgi:hypothetical protein
MRLNDLLPSPKWLLFSCAVAPAIDIFDTDNNADDDYDDDAEENDDDDDDDDLAASFFPSFFPSHHTIPYHTRMSMRRVASSVYGWSPR